jgi:hypothetical protein
MTYAYQRFTAVALLSYGNLFSEWRLLLSECVLVCRRENIGAVIRALSVREFLASKQITVLEQPPYSPDLAPSDFFLFPKIKEILKERHFVDTDNIRSNTTAALKAIPRNQFQNCFEGWARRWHRCIASQGEYFEGDCSHIQQ